MRFYGVNYHSYKDDWREPKEQSRMGDYSLGICIAYSEIEVKSLRLLESYEVKEEEAECVFYDLYSEK